MWTESEWVRDELQAEFGRQVRAVRERRGWTQADLAQQLSDLGFQVTPSQTAKIERGERPTSVPELIALARALRVPSTSTLLANLETGTREQRIYYAEDQIEQLEIAIRKIDRRHNELEDEQASFARHRAMLRREVARNKEELERLRSEAEANQDRADG